MFSQSSCSTSVFIWTAAWGAASSSEAVNVLWRRERTASASLCGGASAALCWGAAAEPLSPWSSEKVTSKSSGVRAPWGHHPCVRPQTWRLRPPHSVWALAENSSSWSQWAPWCWRCSGFCSVTTMLTSGPHPCLQSHLTRDEDTCPYSLIPVCLSSDCHSTREAWWAVSKAQSHVRILSPCEDPLPGHKEMLKELNTSTQPQDSLHEKNQSVTSCLKCFFIKSDGDEGAEELRTSCQWW